MLIIFIVILVMVVVGFVSLGLHGLKRVLADIHRDQDSDKY